LGLPLRPRNFHTAVNLLNRRFHSSRTDGNPFGLEILIVDDAVVMILQILAELASLFKLAIDKQLLGWLD